MGREGTRMRLGQGSWPKPMIAVPGSRLTPGGGGESHTLQEEAALAKFKPLA